MSTDIATREDPQGAIQLILDLEKAGAVDEVSLTLTDPDMPYQRWEDLGRFLGGLQRRVNWYIGDWLNFGEGVYGQESSQAVEATTSDRYNEAERVTGLDHGTLMNISSICRRIAKDRRRKELGFWIHAEVAALEPADQIEWLQKAIDNGWNRSDLRQAIKDAKNPPADDNSNGGGGSSGGESMTIGERIEAAARLVWHAAQSTSDGSFLVPGEPMAQLRSALGEGD